MIQSIDVPAPMRDGVCLSTDIRRPETGGPFPTVLIRTPYGNTGFSDALARMVADGYAVVMQDCRGRFDSGGTFNPLREDADGHDAVAWLAEQPWCDGRIGMTGASYSAFTQMAAAWTRPKGLRAITPSVVGRDLFKDVVYHNGAFNLSLAIGWGTGVAGRSGQTNLTTDWERVFRHLPLMTMDVAAGYRLDYFREWLSHPTYDDYWAAASPEAHYARVDVPAFHVGGWYDVYSDGILRNFCGVRAKGGETARAHQRILVGPWVHGVNQRLVGQLDFGDQAIIPLDTMRRQWLDRWVRGDDNGIDREPPVRIFVMGENVWRDEQEWPLARAEERRLHALLHTRGRCRRGPLRLQPGEPGAHLGGQLPACPFRPDGPPGR